MLTCCTLVNEWHFGGHLRLLDSTIDFSKDLSACVIDSLRILLHSHSHSHSRDTGTYRYHWGRCETRRRDSTLDHKRLVLKKLKRLIIEKRIHDGHDMRIPTCIWCKGYHQKKDVIQELDILFTLTYIKKHSSPSAQNSFFEKKKKKAGGEKGNSQHCVLHQDSQFVCTTYYLFAWLKATRHVSTLALNQLLGKRDQPWPPRVLEQCIAEPCRSSQDRPQQREIEWGRKKGKEEEKKIWNTLMTISDWSSSYNVR